MRLAFLRAASVDPIDLSPTGNGLANTYVRYRNNYFGDQSLPFFPDSGPFVNRFRPIRTPAVVTLEGDSWPQWDRFRAERARAFRSAFLKALKERFPHLSLTASFMSGNESISGSWYGSVDPDLKPGTGDSTGGGASSVSDYYARLVALAHEGSRRAYRSWRFATIGASPSATQEEFLRQTQWSLSTETGAGWDGTILDLTSQPTQTTLSLLGLFTEPKMPPKPESSD
jgi:hypothetical protein